MSTRQLLSNFELITILMQKRIRDIAIERAYTLAEMAIRGEYPDEGFSAEECEIWSNYRFLIKNVNNANSEEKA